MNFSEALELLKQGKRLCRKSFQYNQHVIIMKVPRGNIFMLGKTEKNGEKRYKELFNLECNDILAEDWEVVE